MISSETHAFRQSDDARTRSRKCFILLAVFGVGALAVAAMYALGVPSRFARTESISLESDVTRLNGPFPKLKPHCPGDSSDSADSPEAGTYFKECHFHIYYQTEEEFKLFREFKEKFLDAVERKEFLAVGGGVIKALLPDLPQAWRAPYDRESELPSDEPWSWRSAFPDPPSHGPHPVPDYVIWAPIEYYWKVLEFICVHRGKLSVLIHPLTKLQAFDHDPNGRAVWMGKAIKLKEFFTGDRAILDRVPDEYRSLELGYNANPDSRYMPTNWTPETHPESKEI